MRRAIARLAYYPSLLWNHLLYWAVPGRRYWDQIDEHLLMGAMPLSRHVPTLVDLGVRAVLNMCEEYVGPVADYRQRGVEQLRLPTIDFTEPSLEDVERGVAFITAHVEQGHGVYVHCKAGRGRSATVVLCWLMQDKDLSPEDAFRWLKERRHHVVDGLHHRRVVQAFARRRAGRS